MGHAIEIKWKHRAIRAVEQINIPITCPWRTLPLWKAFRLFLWIVLHPYKNAAAHIEIMREAVIMELNKL